MNEISFWAWIGGDVGGFYPYHHGSGDRLKRQLVRASIAAMDAIRDVDPRARFLQPEPLIHIANNPRLPQEESTVARYNDAQYAVFDLLSGRLPECGGAPQYLDIIGVNYYWENQWMHASGNTPLGHLSHRSLSSMLIELAERYDRPIVISETGAEGASGPGWMHLIAGEAHSAIAQGVPLHGICLYPVSDYVGWDDDRHCDCGIIELDEKYHTRRLRKRDSETLRLLQHLHLPL